MWFLLYLNLICNFCSYYLKKKKKFTSVVCSCLAFRDLLTESITIDEYLFSLSPSKFNCNAFLRSILQNKAQTKFHSFTYQRVWKQWLTNRVEHDKSKGDPETGIEHGKHHTAGCLWSWMPVSCQFEFRSNWIKSKKLWSKQAHQT